MIFAIGLDALNGVDSGLIILRVLAIGGALFGVVWLGNYAFGRL